MYYFAELGRFMARDLVHKPGANRYAYEGNDPVNRADPTGTDDAIAGQAKDADSEEELFVKDRPGATRWTKPMKIKVVYDCKDDTHWFVVSTESKLKIESKIASVSLIAKMSNLDAIGAKEEKKNVESWEKTLREAVKKVWDGLWKNKEEEIKALTGKSEGELTKKINAKIADWVSAYVDGVEKSRKVDAKLAGKEGPGPNAGDILGDKDNEFIVVRKGKDE
jgi:hypothetical protein